MWAFAKAVLLLARYVRRVGVELESIRQLYELDLQSRGIVRVDPRLVDQVELCYGPQAVKKGGEEEW